jgi:DNA-binding LytR/AlgR family response regulator
MQLPESGAFRFTDRSWAAGVPVIVCTTVFEPRVVEALSRHRVEYLVRPFGAEDLHHVLTRARRPDPIDPVLNLRRLLDAAMALGFPVRGRISTWQRGRPLMIEANEIAAIRYVRGRFYLWTHGGIRETPGPAMAIEHLRRARLWLERCHFADVFLRRQPALAKGDRADSLFGNRA